MILQVVTEDSGIIAGAREYFATVKGVRIECEPFFLPRPEINAYLVPFESLGDLVQRGIVRAYFVIAYGSKDFLRRAFLVGVRDYLKDPWDWEEVEARTALLAENFRFEISEVSFSVWQRRLTAGSSTVVLTHSEMRLLKRLVLDQGRIVARIELESVLRGRSRVAGSRSLDVSVSGLRCKILTLLPAEKKAENPILSIKGVGYSLLNKISQG